MGEQGRRADRPGRNVHSGGQQITGMAGKAGFDGVALSFWSMVTAQILIQNELIDFSGLWFCLFEQANGGHDAVD